MQGNNTDLVLAEILSPKRAKYHVFFVFFVFRQDAWDVVGGWVSGVRPKNGERQMTQGRLRVKSGRGGGR